MKTLLKKLFWRADEDDCCIVDNLAESKFALSFGKLLIGELTFSDGKWYFSYSLEFKSQKHIQPLVNFPTKEKEYVSNELWPFFASRIPSDAQLQISSGTRDLIDSLKRYGRQTITNSFVLSPVPVA